MAASAISTWTAADGWAGGHAEAARVALGLEPDGRAAAAGPARARLQSWRPRRFPHGPQRTAGPADTLKLLASHWDSSRMDALLLLVPHARAFNHGGLGDFHMDRSGRLRRRTR